MNKLREIIKTILYAKNGFAIVFKIFVLKQRATAKIGENFLFEVDRENWAEFMNYINFFRYFPEGTIEGDVATIKYGGKNLVFNCEGVGPWVLAEVFGWEGYAKYIKGIDFSRRHVIDIGGYIGDTAIYFARMGAAKVVTVEPVDWLFELTKENIELNNLEHICTVINAGVGSKPLADISKDPTFEVIFGGYKALADTFKKSVPVITLDSIVKGDSVRDGVLKIDCEGWEYDIFDSASDDLLRSFEFIIAEYHYGPRRVADRLNKAGFEVQFDPPVSIHVPERKNEFSNMAVGMLLAKRISK